MSGRNTSDVMLEICLYDLRNTHSISVEMAFLTRLHDLVFADLAKMMGHKFHTPNLWVSSLSCCRN